MQNKPIKVKVKETMTEIKEPKKTRHYSRI